MNCGAPNFRIRLVTTQSQNQSRDVCHCRNHHTTNECLPKRTSTPLSVTQGRALLLIGNGSPSWPTGTVNCELLPFQRANDSDDSVPFPERTPWPTLHSVLNADKAVNDVAEKVSTVRIVEPEPEHEEPDLNTSALMARLHR